MKINYITKFILLSLLLVNLGIVYSFGCERIECFKDSVIYCEKIGQGGQGVIYKVLTKLDKTFKVLKEMIMPSRSLKDFYEARGKVYMDMMRIVPIDNTNIMRIFAYEVNPEYGVFCLLQEYIQGNTMTKYLDEEVTVSKSSKGWISDKINKEDNKNKKLLFLKLLYCMIDSVATINSRDYYHVDVKGDNFMVDTTQNCKLIDFDSTVHKTTDLNKDVEVAFTPTYAAPEIVRYILMKLCKDKRASCEKIFVKGDWIIDQDPSKGQSLFNSDSFAVGIILYESLFGNDNPFYDETEYNANCSNNQSRKFECIIEYFATKYYQISKKIYEKTSFNYELISRIAGSRVIPADFYEVLYKHYLSN